MRKPAAASAPTTVGPFQPSDGMRGDAGRLVDDDEVVVVVDDAEVGHGDRHDLERAAAAPSSPRASRRRAAGRTCRRMTPSSTTPPASAISAARVREKPSSFASPASTRVAVEPVGNGKGRDAPSGLGRELRIRGRRGRLAGRSRRPRASHRRRPPRASPAGLACAVEPDAADREDHEEPHARHDRDVGDVVDRREEPRRRDEVDDVAEAEAGSRKSRSVRLPSTPPSSSPKTSAQRDRVDAPREPA